MRNKSKQPPRFLHIHIQQNTKPFPLTAVWRVPSMKWRCCLGDLLLQNFLVNIVLAFAVDGRLQSGAERMLMPEVFVLCQLIGQDLEKRQQGQRSGGFQPGAPQSEDPAVRGGIAGTG